MMLKDLPKLKMKTNKKTESSQVSSELTNENKVAYQNLSTKQKLAWLEEMRVFTIRFQTETARRFRLKEIEKKQGLS